jgi:hypothetical protein
VSEWVSEWCNIYKTSVSPRSVQQIMLYH